MVGSFFLVGQNIRLVRRAGQEKRMDSINIHLRLDTSPETIVQVSAALLGTVKSTITIEVITSGGSTLLYAIPTLEVYIVYIYWGTMEAMDMDTTCFSPSSWLSGFEEKAMLHDQVSYLQIYARLQIRVFPWLYCLHIVYLYCVTGIWRQRCLVPTI